MTQDELYEALKDNDDARTAMMAEQIELQRQHAAMMQAMMEMLKVFVSPVDQSTEEVMSIDTEDQIEILARECGWDNRRFMTPKDYSIWCQQMRKFARLSNSAPAEKGVQEDQPASSIPKPSY